MARKKTGQPSGPPAVKPADLAEQEGRVPPAPDAVVEIGNALGEERARRREERAPKRRED